MQRIGVFVCWCGSNIAGTVDVKAVAAALAHEPGVVHSAEYQYMCSQAGQNMIKEAIKEQIQKKDGSLVGNMASEGTTPRRLTDLIGSLCDLTSGSGDKGTPIVYIQGYFDNYTTE